MSSSDDDEQSSSMQVAQPKDVSATLKKVKAKLYVERLFAVVVAAWVLRSAAASIATHRQSSHVSKDDDLVYDLGNLYAFDAPPLDIAQLKYDK